jgi:hypothetical protein
VVQVVEEVAAVVADVRVAAGWVGADTEVEVVEVEVEVAAVAAAASTSGNAEFKN